MLPASLAVYQDYQDTIRKKGRKGGMEEGKKEGRE
jgi:hypothetical protein